MTRWGEWIQRPDGGVAHVRHSDQRPRVKPCAVCGAPSALLCDYPVGGGKTCDAPLCRGCAVCVGRNADHCPDHYIAAELTK